MNDLTAIPNEYQVTGTNIAATSYQIEIPTSLITKWQFALDLLADLLIVPVVRITQLKPPHLRVLVTNTAPGSPYHPGDLLPQEENSSGSTVLTTRSGLTIANAGQNLASLHSLDREQGFIFCLGHPLVWPNTVLFGSIEYLDSKNETHPVISQRVLHQVQEAINTDLLVLYQEQLYKISVQCQGLQFAVTRALLESGSIAEAFPALLHAIGQSLDWDYGEIWLVDSKAKVLRWEQSWQGPALPATECRAATQSLTWKLGMEIPENVWRTGKPAWVTDIPKETSFLRASLAVKAGLNSLFAFPILTDGEVTGVILFLSQAFNPPDLDVIDTLADLGSQIGQYLARKQAEEAHRAMARAKDRFLALVSHQLKHPINGVLGFSELLLEELEVIRSKGESAAAVAGHLTDLRNFATDIQYQGQRMARQINALLDMARLEDGEFLLHLGICDLANLARVVILEQQMTTTLHSIQYNGPEHLFIKADEERLDQVLTNLIANAITYSPGGGKVLVSLIVESEAQSSTLATLPGESPSQTVAHGISCSISDEGRGIPAESLAHIFEYGYLDDLSGQMRLSGLGLGLYLCKQIILQHGGTITVESQVGQGTTFRLWLPPHIIIQSRT